MTRAAIIGAAVALACIASPAPTHAPATAAVVQSPELPPPPACRCLPDLLMAETARVEARREDPPAPVSDPAPDPGRSTGALVRVVTGVGGILTGNPPAWAILGQVAYLALSFLGRKRVQT